MKIFGRNRTADSLLDEAVQASRQAAARSTGALSDGTRAAILEGAFRNAAPVEPLPALFVPTWKAAMATGFMVVLGTAGLMLPSLIGSGDHGSTSRLVAYKDGAEVVFEIRNGDGPHRIRKSTDAERFRAEALTVQGGRFRDLADNGPVLVFYKVD